MFRARRKVRFHLDDRTTTVEGILTGQSRGHYVVYAPRVLESEDRTVTVSGHVEIPKARVLFIQILDFAS